VVETGEGVAGLQGPVTLETAAGLLAQLKPLIAANLKTLSFGAVSELDSAALGLILSCRRLAASHGRDNLKFVDLPENLTALAKLYGVSELIAI
jgi:phospholipid transport system transporter-binding protein